MNVDIEKQSTSEPIGLFEAQSVFKGEIPFLTFVIDGKEVGKLWGIGGVLSFEGDCEKSAQVFFDQVIELNRASLEAVK